MRAKEDSLYEFISAGKQAFVIPVFQRNYDWELEQCSTLMSDIKTVCDTNKKHFIGTICFKETDDGELIIIDGQQRITSIMLLVKALHDVAIDKDTKDYLYENILTNKYRSNQKVKMRIKLKPIKKDEGVYTKLIYQPTFDEEAFDRSERRSSIFKNYMYFKKRILELMQEGYTENDICDAIEKLEIVRLKTEDENPQVVFESLNSTGLALTKADLIRNYILMPLSHKDQDEMYRKYWLPMESIFEQPKDVELFILHYLTLKRRTDSIIFNGKKAKIGLNNLYQVFKKEYSNLHTKNVDEIESFFADIKKHANYYRNFVYTDMKQPQNEIEQKLYVLFNIMEKKDSAILLMWIYDAIEQKLIEKELLSEILDIIISFSFRSLVCKNNGLNKQFSVLAVQKLEKNLNNSNDFIDLFYQVITEGSGSFAFPKNSDFRKALIQENLYISIKKVCKYMLHSIEKHINPKEHMPFEDGTIEHICPQTLSKDWKEYLESKECLQNYENFKHNLGNLTLTGLNPDMSNDLFREKKKIYEKSNYSITRDIAKENEWTYEKILNRSRYLAEIALKIWQLPEKYNRKTRDDTGVTYNMDSDFSLLTHSKPHEVEFLGKVCRLNSWKDMLIYVMENLHDLDSDIFEEMIEKHPFQSKLVLSQQEGRIRQDRAYKLSNEKYYLNCCFSTVEILRIIKSAIEFYDKTCATNIIEEISFTIRQGNNDTINENSENNKTQTIIQSSSMNQEKKHEDTIIINDDGEIRINIKAKDCITHNKFGEGTVTKIDDNYIYIRFGIETKMFMYPDAILNGKIVKIKNY